LMVSNGAGAIDSPDNQVELLGKSGQLIAAFSGSKTEVADRLLEEIDRRLIRSSDRCRSGLTPQEE
ncbi:MAG: hypothetical protein MI861_12170, partial [Pirellulales bacterium]|nr:hypothetical protein [Pirellulales bacterium]